MQKFLKKTLIKRKAFSLIELSVIIVILSIIVAGMLSVSVSSVINQKLETTRHNIDKIYVAMGAYILQNGALPCPAPITDFVSNETNYGDATGSEGVCSDVDGVYDFNSEFAYGMVPVKALGLASDVAQDGHGNKFGYVVYSDFTDSAIFGSASYTGGIDVEDKTVSLLDSGELAIFAIISHGANKSGAFNANSATQNALSSDTGETRNYPTQSGPSQITLPTDTITFADSTANSITLQAASTNSNTIFDDMIFFRSRNDVVRDFNALHLIRCPAINGAAGVTDSNYITYNGSTYMDFNSGGYNQVVVSNTDCPSSWATSVTNPGRRCGAYGVWEVPLEHNGTNIAIPCTN